MKRLFVIAVCVICTVILAGGAYAGQFENIISAADVEKATGLSGVKKVPRDKAAPGYTENKLLTGDLNFTRSDGQPILMVQFRPAFIFAQFKADAAYNKGPINGIGSEAFSSPVFSPQYAINFVKGDYYTVVTTHLAPKDKTRTVLTLDQVIAVAKLIASRM